MHEEIREFLSERFLVDFGGPINDDTDLFKESIIDSFGFVELVSFLEVKYEISISEEDLFTDAFTSVNRIVRFVGSQKKNANQ